MSTSKKTLDWYNSNADAYAAHVRNPQDSIYHAYYEKPAIRAEIPNIKGKAVLSLGCGSGEDVQYLKEQGANQATGIDITSKLIEIARRDYPQCEFQVMDMQKLTFPDESFDLVYSSLAIHYLEGGHLQALKEAFRVLKPSGVLLFSDGHPLGSAMETIEENDDIVDIRIQIKTQKRKKTEKVYGDYLTSRMNESKSDWPVEYWHQPLGITINQIIEAGFMLDKVLEFKPTEDMKEVNPPIYERLNRIPEMLVFKAHKPS